MNTLNWTAHPLVDLDSRYRRLNDADVTAQLAAGTPPEVIEEYWQARETRIRNSQGWFQRNGQWVEEADPLRYEFDLPHWPMIRAYLIEKEEVYVFGGNDSAKTSLMAKVVAEVLTRRLTWPGMMAGPPSVLCVAQSEKMSQKVQQRMVYKYLPIEARRLNDSGAPKRKNAVARLNYNRDLGFTNGSFSLANPRGAECMFANVSQFERNELVIEGTFFHLIVIDESAPLSLLETLRFRKGKVGGRLLYCFTPISGFDPVCNNVFTGARLVKSLPMQWDWTWNVNTEPHAQQAPAGHDERNQT